MNLYLSPFIFEFDFGDYFVLFNSYNLSMIKIEKSMWHKIKKYIEKRSFPSNDNELNRYLDELKKRDFIINFDLSQKQDLMNFIEYSYLYNKFYSKTMVLWLSVTSSCNLGCPYCYLNKRKGKSLSPEGASEILKFVNKYLDENPSIESLEVVYFGGEPLLNWDIIEFLHRNFAEIGHQKNVKYYSAIITNGVLFNQQIIDKLNSLNKKLKTYTDIQITIDGMKEYHDVYRPLLNGGSSFDIIYPNLLNGLKVYEGGKITVRSNVNEGNYDSVKELINYLANDIKENKLKFPDVDFMWIYPNEEMVHERGVVSSMNKQQVFRLLELYEFAKSKGFKIPVTVLVQGPCSANNIHSYSIDENLFVYACPGLFYTKKYFAQITNGKLNPIIDKPLFKRIGNLRKCYLSCKYGALCYGGCDAMNRCPLEYFKVFISKRGMQLVME